MVILDSEAETAKKNRRLREQTLPETGERGCAGLLYRALWGETSHRQRCVCVDVVSVTVASPTAETLYVR